MLAGIIGAYHDLVSVTLQSIGQRYAYIAGSDDPYFLFHDGFG